MIPVKCPHCRTGLKVDETKIPEGISSFKCPQCKREIPVSYLKQRAADDGSETVLLRPVEKRQGRLTVLAAFDTPEQVFPLGEGTHLIGRKSSTSEAAIAIQTADRTMSRSHARIDVQKDRRGNLIHTLSDCQSKNHTLYNGNALGIGEKVVLKDNDELRLGRTILRFNFQPA